MFSPESLSTLKNKVAVITGGSRGIGKAIADTLISNGTKVVIGDLLEDEGLETVKSYNEKAGSKVAVFLRTDVSNYSDNKALFQLAETEFGGVDYAILNAGTGLNADSMFSPLDDDFEETIFKVNIIGIIKGTKVALLHMAKRGGGTIIHMASIMGFYSSPNLASYCASKHAIIGYTRSFDLMPAICNVRVNAICPFWIDTDIVKNAMEDAGPRNPLGELVSKTPRATLDTVVDACLTLITDESRNTQVLMALPDGIHIMEPSKPFDSFRNEISDQALKDYIPSAINAGKIQLVEALGKL